MVDPVMSHMGTWWAVFAWVAIFAVFLLFTPFYKRSGIKPNGAFLAFVVALALEMFGVPLSMYALSGVLGHYLPDGILWGHTLNGYVGLAGTYVAIACYLTAAVLIISGWRAIYRDYWSKGRGEGKLVTTGIYRYIRHPQYTGFALITLGMMAEWATLPMLIMWPILGVIYFRLARKEEADMREEFGSAYDEYAEKTGMFLPTRILRSANRSTTVRRASRGDASPGRAQ